MLLEGFGEGSPSLFFGPQHLGNRRKHERRVADGGQLDQPDAVVEVVDRVGPDLQRQAGFARAPWAGQRQQAYFRSQETLPYLPELALAPDEGRRLEGQVV